MMPEKTHFKTIFFDLDGTLIDNFTAIHRCYADVAKQLGLKPKSYEQLRATVGGSIHLTLSRLIGDDLAPEGVRLFREHFPDVMFEDVFVHDGVEWLLKNLRNRKDTQLAVFTNKHYSATIALLDFLKIHDFFDGVFGTDMPDMPWRKPDVNYSKYVLDKMHTLPQDALLIGDSPFDVQAATNSGMKIACVTTGTHMPEALIEASGSPKMIFPDMFMLGKELFKFDPNDMQTTTSTIKK